MEKCPVCKQEIPKVKRDDLTRVLEGWRVQSGSTIEKGDWYRKFAPRYSASAKKLLLIFGNWTDSVDCIQHVFDQMTQAGLSCTLETVLKHSEKYYEMIRGKDGNTPRQSHADQLPERVPS